MIREWMPSDWLGFVMLATLAIVSAFSAYAEYIRSGDIGWLLGGSIILASWPYAYFVIIPVNNLLYGIRNVPASMVRTLMRDWGLLEWSQTGIGLAAACVFGCNATLKTIIVQCGEAAFLCSVSDWPHSCAVVLSVHPQRPTSSARLLRQYQKASRLL
jgi:hypothetical protein